MHHRKIYRKFSRPTGARRALFAGLAMSLIENGRIKTTDAKAKDLRRVAERLVTLAKKGTLDARRLVLSELMHPGKHNRSMRDDQTRAEKSVQVLFGELAPRFKDRHGGYTRVLKVGVRHGDNAPMSFIEFVGHEPKKASTESAAE